MVRHDISASNEDLTVTSWAGPFQADTSTAAIAGDNAVGPAQDSLSATLGDNMWAHPTFTPYMSSQFCTKFKIIGCKSVTMEPNEIRKFKYQLRPKTFKGSWLENGSSLDWQKYWSKMLLVTWVGQPVDNGSATISQGRSVNDCFVTIDATYKFHFMPACEPLYNIHIPEANSNTNMQGVAQSYKLASNAFTPVIPATETVQTVPGYSSTSGTVTATDNAAGFHP